MNNLVYVPYGVLMLAVVLIYAPRSVVGREMAKQEGGYNNNDPRAQQASLTGIGKRALNAHNNAIEALPIFGLGVLAAMQRSTNIKAIAVFSLVFAFARVAYLLLYLRDQAQIRSICWGIGLLASLGLYGLAVVG